VKRCAWTQCGKSFEPKRSNQEYCNRDCRAGAKKLRSRVVRVTPGLYAELRRQMARREGQKKQGNPARAAHRPTKRGRVVIWQTGAKFTREFRNGVSRAVMRIDGETGLVVAFNLTARKGKDGK